MRTTYAVLDGKNVKLIKDVMKWAEWFEYNSETRVVKRTVFNGVLVSTVFLGLDHGFAKGEELWFETCVFFDKLTDMTLASGRRLRESEVVERYKTWEQAEVGHEKWVAEYLQPTTELES